MASIDDAARLTDLVDEGDVGAEPGLWLPWQISTYGLQPPTQHTPSSDATMAG